MLSYILRRLFLIIPTLLGIMVINFLIIQLTPGGPVEQALAEFRGVGLEATTRFSAGSSDFIQDDSVEAGRSGLEEAYIAELKQQFGFDRPLLERFGIMLWQYIQFDFGESYFKGRPVVELVAEKLPVSISLGLWTTLLTYLISIPLGIRKALKDGSSFDIWTSFVIIIGYAIPGFLFGLLLIIVFAGGRYIDWFPIRGLFSEGSENWPWYQQVLDYFWHLALPLIAMLVGAFASLSMLTKNSFLEEIRKQYVQTARAKGCTETRILYRHVFRNAMLVVIAGFPSAFVSLFFTGALLIETMFSLDGLGLLGFQAAISRDYPIMFATLYVFTLIGLVLNLLSDLMYVVIDPRIDFERRQS